MKSELRNVPSNLDKSFQICLKLCEAFYREFVGEKPKITFNRSSPIIKEQYSDSYTLESESAQMLLSYTVDGAGLWFGDRLILIVSIRNARFMFWVPDANLNVSEIYYKFEDISKAAKDALTVD